MHYKCSYVHVWNNIKYAAICYIRKFPYYCSSSNYIQLLVEVISDQLICWDSNEAG